MNILKKLFKSDEAKFVGSPAYEIAKTFRPSFRVMTYWSDTAAKYRYMVQKTELEYGASYKTAHCKWVDICSYNNESDAIEHMSKLIEHYK